jgi:hypothetical protein
MQSVPRRFKLASQHDTTYSGPGVIGGLAAIGQGDVAELGRSPPRADAGRLRLGAATLRASCPASVANCQEIHAQFSARHQVLELVQAVFAEVLKAHAVALARPMAETSRPGRTQAFAFHGLSPVLWAQCKFETSTTNHLISSNAPSDHTGPFRDHEFSTLTKG